MNERVVCEYKLDIDWDLSEGYATAMLSVPINSSVLKIDYSVRGGCICAWAEIDHDEKQFMKKKYFVCPTGRTLPDEKKWHITTIFQGLLVWHIYLAMEE